jgi:uncharacterized protein (DUF1697 family)
MPSRRRPHVALLRGVNNIGTTKRVAMADLRALFEDLGFRDVSTVLNSGNVVFSAAGRGDVAARIEKGLAGLGVRPIVTILSAAEVVSAVRDNPLSKVATRPSDLLVVVPHERSDLKRLRPLLDKRWAPEALALGRRVAYVWCGAGIPRSPLWNAVDRALARTGTARNLATLTRLMALVAAPDS